ncbi:MAG TPA: hypothetical protein VKB39_08350 [Candidatus Baltobacteraceae bacterium]|nr:hypothetical protein [Candidatus Baltobacteraceae bacterium]
MERDDVFEAWASLEAQLKRTEQLNDLIVVESLSRRAQTPLNRERFFLWFEIGINVLGIVAIASFGADHAGTAAGISAAILGAALIAINAVLTSIAVGLTRLDFENPVLTLQAELARLQTRRAALVTATLAGGPLLWTPLLVFALGLFGIDAVRALGVPYILANVAFGALLAVAAWLAARIFGERLRGSKWCARAVDALSGKSYGEAADYLDTIERYREG